MITKLAENWIQENAVPLAVGAGVLGLGGLGYLGGKRLLRGRAKVQTKALPLQELPMSSKVAKGKRVRGAMDASVAEARKAGVTEREIIYNVGDLDAFMGA